MSTSVAQSYNFQGEVYYDEYPFIEDELDFSSDNDTDETFKAHTTKKKKKGFRMKPGPKVTLSLLDFKIINLIVKSSWFDD